MNEPGVPRICSIHCHNAGCNDKVQPFTSATLKKCSDALKVRKYCKLQYADIDVPVLVDEKNGYHSVCYRKFTAVKQRHLEKVPPVVMRLPHTTELDTRDCKPGPSTDARLKREKLVTSSGVLHKLCLFCGKKRKIHAKREQKLFLSTRLIEKKVMSAAAVLDDRRILTALDQGDFVAKEVRYHDICLKRFINKADSANRKQQPGYSDSRRISYAEGFEFIFAVVEEDVLNKEKVFTISELLKIFNQKIQIEDPAKTIKPSYLEQKILNNFPLSILIDRSKKDHIVFKSNMNFIPSVVEAKLNEMKKNSILRDAAFSLRKEILTANQHQLPSRDVTLHDVYQGECDIPSELKMFIENLIYGPTVHHDSIARNQRIDSICSDLIFTATNGRLKPAKQLLLGSATKSLTGSKKMINILNRLGHSVSYTSIEEMETELSYSSHQSTSIIPLPIKKLPNLFTGVAFNNFDRFVETLTGKNTLHDTVGIIFQNATSHDQMEIDNVSEANDGEERDASNSADSQRRRRAFEEVMSDIEPYMKTPRLLNFAVMMNPLALISTPKDFRVYDLLWALKFQYTSDCPMWVGFNALQFEDDTPQQTLAYLPQINSSPTSYAVVRHTLKVAKQVKEECGQDKIICTYDLNIARMALEIQSQEAPLFKDVFVGLGPFHIELALFKAIGKFIDGSGVVEVLTEAGILAHGSVLGFIGGTNYNRCKRIHRLLALCLRKLHHDLFISFFENDPIQELDLQKMIETVTRNKLNWATDDITIQDPDLKSLLKKYSDFEEKTAQGYHGMTAQIWMIYIQFIDNFNDFNRSQRMGDIVLFVHSLSKISDLFFTFNHQNYARWLVPFTDNIINSLTSGDYISEQLRRGLFTVKRTSKSFSRTPIDLTLEQTINANAGNKLSGVVSVTNSISARQRWAYSHSQRTEIVSHLMDDIGLTAKEDSTKDLRKGRIACDHQHYEKILEVFNSMMNPFDRNLEPNTLFNICTGKSASPAVLTFLKEAPNTGHEQHLNFRRECSLDSTRFYKPIKRNSILNFPADRPKFAIKRTEKTHTIKMERNLFCRLLTLSLKEKIDLQSVLQFPLTPVPLSLGYYDGTPVKTQKSVLLKYLEGFQSNTAPTTTDVLVVDGFYLLHQLGNNLPTTYGGIATAILKKLQISKCPCIHLVFDRYVSPSIKDLERESRSGYAGSSSYHVQKSEQKRPVDFIKALRSIPFKNSLVNFLVNEWASEKYAEFFHQFVLYVNREEICYFFYSVSENLVFRHEERSLRSGHIEADSRMVYHITTLTNPANVVIRTCDTDVLVIALGNMHVMREGVDVWLETGTVSRNDHRFINTRQISEALGIEMCKALPALHALTGCDYTSAFYRIGKKAPFNVVKGQPNMIKMLSNFGSEPSPTREESSLIEKFVCQLYSRREFADINELRVHLFMDAYRRNCDKNPLKIPKGIESTNFPPCKKVLHHHVLRAKFVTLMWSNLHLADPPNVNAIDYGWEEENGLYKIKWFEGPALPERLEDIIIAHDNGESDDESDAISDTSDEEDDD